MVVRSSSLVVARRARKVRIVIKLRCFRLTHTRVAACQAIDDLLESSRIDTLLSNFIVPLQGILDQNNRVHASMNLNTEARRANTFVF